MQQISEAEGRGLHLRSAQHRHLVDKIITHILGPKAPQRVSGQAADLAQSQNAMAEYTPSA